MNIKSITTGHITKNPFFGLVEIEGEFEPYYVCTVITDTGKAIGRGETAQEAEENAIELLKSRETNKVADALSKYNAENGVYFVDC